MVITVRGELLDGTDRHSLAAVILLAALTWQMLIVLLCLNVA